MSSRTAVRRSYMTSVTLVVALVASLVVMIDSPATAHGNVDQQLTGPDGFDPACTMQDLPGAVLLESPQRQSFVPERGGLLSVDVCMEVLLTGSFDLTVYRGGTVDAPGEELATRTVTVSGLGNQWVHVELDVASTPAGTPYVLEMQGLSVTARWRASCTGQLLGLGPCDPNASDQYPAGTTNSSLGPNADFGFRTYTPAVDLAAHAEVDGVVCPGLAMVDPETGRQRASATVTNHHGLESVGTFFTEWVWSQDAELGGADDQVIAGSRFEVAGLAPGEEASIPPPDHLPDDIPLGPGHLLLHVDVDSRVSDGSTFDAADTTVTQCGQPDIQDLAVEIDETRIPTGFRAVQAADLPLGPLAQGLPTSFDEAQANLEASPYGFSPVGFSPVGFSPLGFSPVGFSPVGFSPYGFSPVGFSPVGFSPVGFSPVGFSPLADVLDDVPPQLLDTILVVNVPIVSPGWEQRLGGMIGDRPVQDITLREALTLLPDLSVQDVDTRALVNAGWLEFALANGTMNDLPVPPGSSSWCDHLRAAQDYSCASTGLDPANQSLLAATALGVNTAALPIGGLTLDAVSINPAWLVNSMPLTENALTVPETQSRAHVDLTRLGSLRPAEALTETGLGTLLDCESSDCDLSLGELAQAGAFRAGTTVGDLLDGLSPTGLSTATVTDLGLLLADFGSLDLGDMFWPVVDPHDVDDRCPPVTYRVTGNNAGAAGAVEPVIAVTLAQGFGHVPGSATFSADGAAATIQEEPITDIADDGTRTLTFVADAVVESSFELTFQACANLYTGFFDAGTAEVRGDGIEGSYEATSAGSPMDRILVVEQTEEDGPTDTPETAQPLGPNAVVAFNLQSAEDTDHFQVPVPDDPNSLTIVRVFAPPGVDVDAWAHGPAVSPLGFSPVGFSPVGFSPVGFSPVGFSPYGFSPLGFSPYGFSPLGFSDDGATTPDTLNDVPTHLAPSDTTGLRAVSASRGNLAETLVLRNHDGDDGVFTIGVSGYNGIDTAAPTILTVQQVSPSSNPALEACTPAPWSLTSQAGSSPVVDWDEPRTLFVTNRQVVASAHGQAAADAGIAALHELAARDEVRGIVLEVDHDPNVRAAYADWRNDWCSPTAANIVANRVREEVLELRGQFDSIDTIVLAGGDEILPDFRLVDTSLLANEVEYTDALLAAYGQNNPVVAAYASGLFPSADPYGTEQPAVYGQGFAYTPSAGVSRLVEGPDVWVLQKDQYVASDGALDPGAGFVSADYGMVDGATAAVDALEGQGVATDLLAAGATPWSADDFRAGAFATDPDVGGWNAHANHWGLLSSLGSDNGDDTEIVTSGELASIPLGGLVFSNGCHFGTQVPDLLHPGNPSASQAQRLLDWDDAITQRQGIAVANSGFGIFDTEVAGYGEQLQTIFVEELQDAPNAALALAAAKAKYFASLGNYDSYHYKTMQQLSMYGLGILKMFGSSGGPDDGVAPPAADSIPVSVGPFTVNGSGPDCVDCLRPHATDSGTYYDLQDDGTVADSTPLSISGRPIVPKVTLDTALPDGKAGVGVWLNGIDSVEVGGIDPAISRAAVSRPDREGEDRPHGSIFPTTPALAVDVGDLAFVTLNLGGFRSADPVNGETRGTLRLDTRIDAELLLRDETTDGPAPFVREVTTAITGGLVAVDVVADETFGANTRAAALGYDDTGTWTYRELTQGANGHWTGALALPSGATELIELLVQVRNDHRIAYWRNKGEPPRLDIDVPSPVDLAFSSSAGQADNGVFLGPVTARIVGIDDVVYTAADGDHIIGQFTTGDTFTVAGDGVHEIEVVGSDGSRVRRTIVIDGSDPVVVIVSPSDGAEFAPGDEVSLVFTAADTGTGVATCMATVNGEAIENGDPLPTDAIGTHTVSVTCTDAVAHSGSDSATYTVSSTYTFEGFFEPVVNLPGLNEIRAGETLPFKFRVLREDGSAVTSTSVATSATWVEVDCTTRQPVPGAKVEPAVSSPSFRYDDGDGHFIFNAQTSKRWKRGSCFRFTLTLDDGSQHQADVVIK